MLCAFSIKTNAQTITIDSTFTSDAVIHPFGSNDTIYGISMTGSLTLNSDTSLVRVIFVDDNYLEYLLYEAYPFIVENWNFNIVNEGEETKYLNETKPNSIYIQLINADLEITSLYLSESYTDFTDSLQVLHKAATESSKINRINTNIEQYGMIWLAGETSVSKLSYTEKKNLFGDKYNLLGMEYYSGGIYDPTPNVYGNMQESDLVPEFDWRNRHGANDPDKIISYYYNDDNGWLTPVKNQMIRDDCEGLCYIYGPLGVAEAVANVYFNQHLQINLSEQQVLDCDGFDGNSQCATDCDCGLSGNTVSMLAVSNGGIVDENCYPIPDPYIHPHSCIGNPINPNHQIRIPGGTEYVSYYPPPTMDEKKQAIIENGPLLTSIGNYSQGQNHSMVLAGFGKIAAGDTLFPNPTDSTDFELVHKNSQSIGQTYWIFKNSWGTDYGDDGYMYHIERDGLFKPEYCKYFVLPVIDEINNYDIDCLDKDNDGYFNWGISEQKPTTCPTCPDDRDSDDSDPRIGHFDDNYYGTPVSPHMIVGTSFQEIPNGGFMPFTDLSATQDFSIIVQNAGNAQLNFDKVLSLPYPYADVSLSGPDYSHFSYNHDLDTIVPMNNESRTFTISYDGLCSNSATCIVTIHLNEPDMDDFVFAIVFADCDHTPTNITISGTETWSDWRIVNDNYKIEHGGKLTITGHVGFTDQAKFIIDEGGEVIIDGGTLINACSSLWSGIEVWGGASLSQYPSSNQGCLKIINGGCIENAEAAVQLTRLINGEPSFTKNGGIIRCDSALFKNNGLDVAFHSYNNIHPTTLLKVPNRSYFYNTQFINDEICEKQKYTVLNDVDGIAFKGCSFVNNVDKDLQNCVSVFRGIGIYSSNSGFFIDEYCTDNQTPCENTKACVFENLHYGIYAANGKRNEAVNIDSAIFLNTYRGIFMNRFDYATLSRNKFIYNEEYQTENPTDTSYCLNLEHCNGYFVQENVFSNTSSASRVVGLHILNSGPYANEIYNNSFHGFDAGIIAAGENRNGTEEGLCLKCNDFWNCETDISITGNGGSTPSNLGIRQQQGSANGLSDGPASNTFTDENNYPVVKNVANNTNSINYAHHLNQDGQILEPDPITSGTINLQPDQDAGYSKEQSCPSNLGGGIDPQTEMITLTFETSQVVAYEDTLNQVVDGGNTDELNLDIQTSFPNEAMQVRQELLNESPYLSDTVMETAINKENVLPNVMIRDILVANPQSAKSAEVLNTLDDRFTPMPDYMMAEIMLGQNTIGAKEVLEQELAKHKTTRSRSYQQLVRHYLQDTINACAFDSLASIFLNEASPCPRYELAFLYLDRGDSTSMQNTLDNIPAEFELSEREETIHDLFIDYFDILYELTKDSVSLIDSIQQLDLMEIADNSHLLPGIYARNLLLNYGLMEYKETVYLPESLKHAPIIESPSFSNTENAKLIKVYPNPAGTYFIIEYDLRETFGVAVVILSDINGRMLDSFALKDKQNQQLLSTNPFSPGLHILQLFINGELRETHKLQIVN